MRLTPAIRTGARKSRPRVRGMGLRHEFAEWSARVVQADNQKPGRPGWNREAARQEPKDSRCRWYPGLSRCALSLPGKET
jgi:hypothetical protein